MKVFDFTEVYDLLSPDKKIAVVTHLNPDGDAIGSALGLCAFLRQISGNAEIVLPNEFPAFLAWMPGSSEMTIHTRNPRKAKALLSEADLIFCLDFNSLSRTGNLDKLLQNSTATRILIDHHIDPERESFHHLFSDVRYSSTSEMVYHFITSYPGAAVTKEIAESLYAGIMTDTGSFSYSCNRPETYIVVSHLIECGVDVEKIHRLVYDTYSESRMRLLGFSLSERLVVLPELCTAYIWLGRDDLKRFNYRIGDTEGVVNYALAIKGIRFAALFTERDNRVRISLRSKGNFSVNDFARAHYEGGGHRNAAGADSYLNLKDTLARFEELLPLYSEILLNGNE